MERKDIHKFQIFPLLEYRKRKDVMAILKYKMKMSMKAL